MPRKPKLLPYLQRLASGRLRYTRRVPSDLQEFLGNRRYITVLMPDDARESTDKRLIKAWNEATTQVDAEIAAAQAEKEARQLAIEAATNARHSAAVAVIDGQGVALNDELVAAEIRDGRMFRLSSEELSDFGYFIAYEPDTLGRPDTAEFINWLKSVR